MSVELLLVVLDCVHHIIVWCFNYRRILRKYLFLLQEFLHPCKNIAHDV